MLEALIVRLSDMYEKCGDIDVGFLDENGIYRKFRGLSVLPEDSTVVISPDEGVTIQSFHMKIKNKSVIIF